MKLKLIMLTGLLTLGFAMNANAGSVIDTDSDLVPDAFDNCLTVPNGPNEAPANQTDSDTDGYGNICDADFDNMGASVGGLDFGVFLSQFGSPLGGQTDMNSDGNTNVQDFQIFLSLFGGPPGGSGGSGLACAGTVPCTP